ncbi:MAG: hypothetical protein ACSW8K_01445 [bacterium]
MNLKKLTIIAVFVLLAAFSVTVLAPWASDPGTHRHTIEQTDQKIRSVMALSGGAAATSATLSLLPGDMCTPLADQLAELAKYFLLILSALYLEKFLIGFSGYFSFSILIPLALVVLAAAVLTGRRSFAKGAVKIASTALIIFIIVPASVLLSDMVYQTQEAKIDQTLEEYNELEIEGDAESGFFNEFSTVTTETVDRVTSFMDDTLESLAIMMVTSCLIPLLVFVFLVWLARVIFPSNVLFLDPVTSDAILGKIK